MTRTPAYGFDLQEPELSGDIRSLDSFSGPGFSVRLDNLDDGSVYVSNFLVDPAVRGRGYGTLVLDALVREADRQSVNLCLVPGNDFLKHWYELAGFVVDPSERGIGKRPFMRRESR